jgi:hypothetical protein
LVLAGNTWFYDDVGDINVSADDYSKLPALEFLYGDYWLQALPEDYMHSYAGSYWACFTEADTEANFILGSAFLRGYYSVHDYATMRFGFAPHDESTKRAAETNSADSIPLPESAGSI